MTGRPLIAPAHGHYCVVVDGAIHAATLAAAVAKPRSPKAVTVCGQRFETTVAFEAADAVVVANWPPYARNRLAPRCGGCWEQTGRQRPAEDWRRHRARHLTDRSTPCA